MRQIRRDLDDLVFLAGATWAIGAIAVVAGAAVEGHTRSAHPVWLAFVADVLHVGGASIWLGGVAALVACRTTLVGRRRRTADVSMHALVAAVVVAAAGVGMAVVITPDLDTFAETRWGRAIVAKVVLLAVLICLGWYNRARLVPRLSTDGPAADRAWHTMRRVMTLELAAFAGVLVATGVAVGSPPAAQGRPDPTPSPHSELVPLSSGVGGVQFALTPGVVGYNDLYLQIDDLSGVPLETIFEPTAALAAPGDQVAAIELTVHVLGDGAYHVPVWVPFAGRWEITVDARTDTFESGSATITPVIDD